MKFLSKDEQLKLCEQYRQNVPLKNIALSFGVSYTAIYNALKREGISCDYSIGRHQNRRKHEFLQNFFEDINSEEKAYYLGFLMADGWISQNTIGLASKDLEVIEGLKSAIKAESIEIKRKKNCKGVSNAYVLYINSQKMVNDLARLSLVNNKYSRTEIPNISNELIHHFIRGYFDGDGCLYLREKMNSASVSITSSSYKILEQILNTVKELCPSAKIRNRTTYHIFLIENRQDTKQFCEYIYENAAIFLKRKYKKYVNLKNNYFRKKRENTKSIYFGVSAKSDELMAKLQTKRRYHAYISFNKKRYSLGNFLTENEAALAYNKKAIELGISNEHLNVIK